jgi:Fe2+ transport system protein FeoA
MTEISKATVLGTMVFALCSLLLAPCSSAQAQQPAKIPRIGYQTGSLGTATNPDPTTHAFRQRLRELGYIEGKNVAIEFRVTEGKGPNRRSRAGARVGPA